MKKLLSKFKNQFIDKFNKLSLIKKIVLIMFVLFGLFWYWLTNTLYYYIIHTLGIPQLSSISGVSIGTIDWILFRLPIYFTIISFIIFFPIILIIYLNKKKIIPNKYRKADSELTYQDVKEDQKNFEDVTYHISDETIGRFYEDKADYIQIGNGYGLYHPKTDKAKLGTEKFHGKFFLRFRAKRHTTKNFHCYSFFTVIKCKKLDKKSRYNIEETDDQEFPPIKP